MKDYFFEVLMSDATIIESMVASNDRGAAEQNVMLNLLLAAQAEFKYKFEYSPTPVHCRLLFIDGVAV